MSSIPFGLNIPSKDPGEPPDKGEGDPKQEGGVEKEKLAERSIGLSFKEKLLEMKESEKMDHLKDVELVENRWYMYEKEEEAYNDKCYVYDPCPKIRVSKGELEDWSQPWKEALVVSLLGKMVSFRVLENKLNQDWARNSTLRITNLPKNFYVVQF